jgi:hypothetical protein
MDVNCTGINNCYLPSGTQGVLSTSNNSYNPAFGTTTGWDFATGIGTLNATNLVNHWPASVPNFALSASPSSLSITQAGPSGTTTITVTPQNAFSGTVNLSASGLPTGVTASFDPTSTTTTSTLTLSANSTAATGAVNVTITGTSNSLNPTTQISLTVLAQTWRISGTITNGSGATVTLSGAASATTTADASGNYSFGSLVNGSYTLTPSKTGLTFTPASQQVTVNGGDVTAVNFTAQASLIPHSLWSVLHVDSQETTCENGAAANAIDGNPSTKWVTQWCPNGAPLPHEIQINLGASYSLSAFQYLPRQDGCGNGWIKQYAFYVSTDGVNWGTAVASGTFSYSGLSTACPGGGVPATMQVDFTPVTGQYVRLQALSEINGNPWTAAAEINVLGQ